ncbi:MAG: PepSY-associated TM helix domain-containing protein [Burkholderiales bacterium]|nr:PepSY-associated TM helix domain-containing protein [Burkholderiales bacterium]
MPSSPTSTRAAWLKTLHQWHWVSSAICLIGMLLFALTGITLNHAADIPAQQTVQQRSAQLPADLRALLRADAADDDERKAELPPPVRDWLQQALDIELPAAQAEWSLDEVYIALPRPGGDAWLRIARDSGEVEYERTDRGWISYLNDLHKGRHTGAAWKWFLDVFAAACLVFCLTGLLILKFHAAQRPGTWPMVALGLVLPLLLLILFTH